VITVTAPARLAKPNVVIDSEEEKLNTEASMQYKLSGEDNWAECTENMALSEFGWNGTAAVTVQFRYPSTNDNYASDPQTLTIHALPVLTGTGSVTISGWTYGGTAAEPVPVSATNGTGSVTYNYDGTKADGLPYSSSTKPSAAGSYTVTATFSATSEYKSVTSEPASFTIQRAPVTFAITNNSVLYDSEPKTASITATANSVSFAGFTVTCKQGDTLVSAPVNVGIYDIYASVDDKNYRHIDGADGAERKIGVLTILGQTSTYCVGGVVTRNGSPAEGAVVTLMHGPQKVGEIVTDTQGRYQFNNVPPGIYNLTGAKDGVTITIMKEVKTADVMGADIELPLGKTNSVVEVLAGTPAIVVGNLEKIFGQQDGTVFTNADQATVNSGGTVEIRIVARVVAEDPGNSDQNMITGHAPGSSLGLFLEMNLNKSVTSGGSPVVTPLTASNTLLEIVVPLPAELQGKDNYIVYRCHGSEVQTLTTIPNTNGEYMMVNAGKTAITIHAKLFSTYSIGYLGQQAPGNSGKGSRTVKAAPVKTEGLPYYLDVDGDKIFLGFSFDRSGEVKYIAPEGKTVLFEKNAKSFTDISNHWAKSNIEFITQREVFQGTDTTKFSPDSGMTRGMFAAVIGRLYERSYGLLSASGTTAFKDVAAGAYYENYVNWADKNGIMEGSGGGRFAPDRMITRGEMASVLYRFARFLELSGTDMTGIQLSYSDTSEISAWAIDAAKYCQETNLIAGRSNGKFASKETATRAEVATILQRFIEAAVK